MDRNLSVLCKECEENKKKHCSMNYCMNNCGVPLDVLKAYEELRTKTTGLISLDYGRGSIRKPYNVNAIKKPERSKE
jgi:hypothetical protein